MTALIGIRKKLHHYFLKRKISRSRKAVEMVNSANEIILMYNAANEDHNFAVRKYSERLIKEKKVVSLLGFMKNIPDEIVDSSRYLSNADLNWLLNPHPNRVNKILQTKFDLLINFYPDECLALEYIAALSHAKLRVGRYVPDKVYCYDLMVQLKDNENIEEFINQVDHCLKYINKDEQH